MNVINVQNKKNTALEGSPSARGVGERPYSPVTFLIAFLVLSHEL
jgi:hypothetical protein